MVEKLKNKTLKTVNEAVKIWRLIPEDFREEIIIECAQPLIECFPYALDSFASFPILTKTELQYAVRSFISLFFCCHWLIRAQISSIPI